MSTQTITLPTPGVYALDPYHTEVNFQARHLIGTKVRGQFKEFTGTFTVAENLEDSTVEAVVQAASVDTGNEMRDNHLRSNDFFDMEQYPTLEMKSTGLTKVTDSEWKLAVDLTIKGKTLPVVFDLEYHGQGPSMTEGESVVAFSATAEIDRRDWDVSFNGSLVDGSVVVGNKVKIEIEVEAGLAK